ncbi:hypothetical protein, partial [Chitinibacter sp. ZOR0017]|uniref:hypothetical protein n=1 Tax=Chitinibacter sp. ZOR0017 TaxID=1339254 RepID=UPI001E32A1E6
ALRGGSGKALNTGKAKPRTTSTTDNSTTNRPRPSQQTQKQSPATLGFVLSDAIFRLWGVFC